MKNYAFLFWAYTVVWLALASYVLLLGAKLRRAARRLDGLERTLGGGAGTAASQKSKSSSS